MFYNYLLFYFPTEIIGIMITLHLFNLRIRVRYLLLLPLLHIPVFYYIMTNQIYPFLVISISILSFILITRIVLKFGLFQVLFLVVVAYLIYLPLEQLSIALNILVFENNYREIFSSFPRTLTALIPLLFVLLIIYQLVKKYNFTLLTGKIDFTDNKVRAILWIIVILALEHISYIFYLSWNNIFAAEEIEAVQSFILLISVVSSILLIILFYLFRMIDEEIRLGIAEEVITNLSRLNYTLKCQKHDFKHHLQIIMSLIQRKRYNKALKYINEVSDEYTELTEQTNTGIPALDGLLEYQLTLARRIGIEIIIDIHCQFNCFPLKDSELCRVIGNLLSNSIDYLSEDRCVEKYIQLIFEDTNDDYHIQISNPVDGDFSIEQARKFTMPGYTTKGKNHGLGLTIIQEIVSNAGGVMEIELDQGENILTLSLTIPRAARALPS